MNDLRVFNEQLYNDYLKLSSVDELASPNIVSSKKFLNDVNKHPIMYVGQETYGWVNYNDGEVNLDTIEDAYDHFFFVRGTSKTHYWRFIKNIVETDYCDLHKDVVWTNTIIAGKRYDKGAPYVTDKLKELSVKNLLFLYEFFEPSCVISVAGNNNPYYDITTTFLKKIDSKLVNKWPTQEKPLIMDDEKKIAWTYHPMRLMYDSNFDNTVSGIKELIKNTK